MPTLRKFATITALLTVSFVAQTYADAFAFSGTGNINSTALDFSLSGPNITFFSSTPDGIHSGFGGCSQGALCTLDVGWLSFIPPAINGIALEIPAYPAPKSFNSSGCLNGVCVSSLQGDIVFTGLPILVPIPSNGPFALPPLPVLLNGDIQGFDFQTNGYIERGPIVFGVGLQGIGFVTLDGFASAAGGCRNGLTIISGPCVQFNEAQFNYVGLATPVPEPSALLLVGTGLLGTAGALRKKLRS